MIKGASVGGMLGGLNMARKPASMYRRLKGQHILDASISVVFRTTVFLHTTLVIVVPQRQADSQLSSNFVLTTTVRSDTLHSKQPVLFPTPPFVRRLVHKVTLSVFTPTHTTFSEKTSKRPVQVLTVFLKVCDVLSERTSEQPLVSAVASESFPFTAMQRTTLLPKMLYARPV